jgi:hypothetical protein
MAAVASLSAVPGARLNETVTAGSWPRWLMLSGMVPGVSFVTALRGTSVGALSEPDANKALQDPTKAVGVEFEAAALKEIFRLTQGYPYFIQEWGYQSWNRAAGPPITLQVVQDATATVIQRLDENFFRVRFDRLTPGEKKFLRAMAGLDPKDRRSGEIAEVLEMKIQSLGPPRANLIQKGMIYSPAHGDMAFTVPLFGEFMLRAMPELPKN